MRTPFLLRAVMEKYFRAWNGYTLGKQSHNLRYVCPGEDHIKLVVVTISQALSVHG